MTLANLLGQLEELYEGIFRAAQDASRNSVRSHLPVKLVGPGRCTFTAASSLAVQSVIPDLTKVHEAFQVVVARYHSHCPDVAEVSFWQPRGTFHLNVVILQRLSMDTVPLANHQQIVNQASPLLDWLDNQRAYRIEFHGVLVAPDGTIMAKGYPLCTAPWRIRQRFMESGFEDQQRMFHVTIGRILRVLPDRSWKSLIKFTDEQLSDRYLGSYHMREAVLVSEREGFLHDSSCYQVIRRFKLRG